MEGLICQNIMQVEITGSGVAFPEKGKWVTNEDIHAMLYGQDWKKEMARLQVDPGYFKNEMGFQKRYWVHTPGTEIVPDELTSADLMVAAARQAIEESNLSNDDIDFVIAVTITSPRYTTSMGPFISKALELKAPAMEMKTGCASNIFSFILAAQLIQNGARNVLIACGETNSKILRNEARMLYPAGDAGSAIIVSKSQSSKKGIVAAMMNSNGAYSSFMGVPGLLPPNKIDLEDDNYRFMYSNRAELFISRAWASIPPALYKTTGLTGADIDCLIPHQVHLKRIMTAAKEADISFERTVNIVGDYANCGSATILLAIDHARKNNRLPAGGLALIEAVGGGVSWGGMILRT